MDLLAVAIWVKTLVMWMIKNLTQFFSGDSMKIEYNSGHKETKNSHNSTTGSHSPIIIGSFNNDSADARRAYDQLILVKQQVEILCFEGTDRERHTALKNLPILLKNLLATLEILNHLAGSTDHLLFIKKLITIASTCEYPHQAITAIEKLDGISGIAKLSEWFLKIYQQ